MTNYEKYEQILDMIPTKTQSEIVNELNCSFGTITRAKQWEAKGKPIKITKPKKKRNSQVIKTLSELGLLNAYNSLHKLIREMKGEPNGCEECGSNENICLANLSGKYHIDVNDYKYLCRTCHMDYDTSNETHKAYSRNFIFLFEKFHSRFLSFLTMSLDIKGYCNMTKSELIEELRKKVDNL